MTGLIVPNTGKPTPATHTRITDDVTTWVRAALETGAHGERVRWEASFQMIPTDQGMQPAIWLLLSMASPVLGQELMNLAPLGLDALNERAVTNVVAESLEVLRRRRSEALAGVTNGMRP